MSWAPFLFLAASVALPFAIVFGQRRRRQLFVRDLGTELGDEVSRRERRVFLLILIIGIIIAAPLAFLSVPDEALIALFSGLGLAHVSVYLLRRRGLGPVALELPWSEWNTRAAVASVLSTLPALIEFVSEGRLELLDLAWLIVATFFLVFGLDRFQVREGGIVALGSVLPWKKISSLTWGGNSERPVLLFESAGPLAPLQVKYWLVPPGRERAVREVVQRFAATLVTEASEERPRDINFEVQHGLGVL